MAKKLMNLNVPTDLLANFDHKAQELNLTRTELIIACMQAVVRGTVGVNVQAKNVIVAPRVVETKEEYEN